VETTACDRAPACALGRWKTLCRGTCRPRHAGDGTPQYGLGVPIRCTGHVIAWRVPEQEGGIDHAVPRGPMVSPVVIYTMLRGFFCGPSCEFVAALGVSLA
jgi:hypothetical protein